TLPSCCRVPRECTLGPGTARLISGNFMASRRRRDGAWPLPPGCSAFWRWRRSSAEGGLALAPTTPRREAAIRRNLAQAQLGFAPFEAQPSPALAAAPHLARPA